MIILYMYKTITKKPTSIKESKKAEKNKKTDMLILAEEAEASQEASYTYVSEYAKKKQRQRENAIRRSEGLLHIATSVNDGIPLSDSRILCNTISSIITVPCPMERKVNDGVEAIDSLLNGILILSSHGIVNFAYNLTTAYTIPYRMLTIYTIPFSFLGQSSPNVTIPSHRMNKLIKYQQDIYDTLLIKIENSQCEGITPRNLLAQIKKDSSIKDFQRDLFTKFPQIHTQASELNMDVTKIGLPHIGTPVNQTYSFSNYYFYNNKDVHDSFSGLFITVFCISEDGPWVSSNYMPIIFSKSPIKMSGVIKQTYNESTLLDAIKTMPVYDLTSMRDIKKIKNIDNTLLNLIIKMLIARNVTFTSSIAEIIVKHNEGQTDKQYSIPIRLDYGLIESGYSIIDNASEVDINGLPINNNNVKISRISSEDVSVLLYVLWFISNEKWIEINVIMNLMNQMYFYYYHIMMKTMPQNNPDISKDESELINKMKEDTSILPLVAITTFNTLINNYIHEQATIYKITFATINSVCRPNAIPEENETLQLKGVFTQECEIALDCSPKMYEEYDPIEVHAKIVIPSNIPIIDIPIDITYNPTSNDFQIPEESHLQPNKILFSKFINLFSTIINSNAARDAYKSIKTIITGRRRNNLYFEDLLPIQTAIGNIEARKCIEQGKMEEGKMEEEEEGKMEAELEIYNIDEDIYLSFIKQQTNTAFDLLQNYSHTYDVIETGGGMSKPGDTRKTTQRKRKTTQRKRKTTQRKRKTTQRKRKTTQRKRKTR
jgi:hypothetical protein